MNGYSYIFNTLNFSYFRTSENAGRVIESSLNESNLLEKLPTDLYNKLIQGGFVVDDDYDELEKIRRINDSQVNRKDYFLVVMPTLDCNYKCWYCIQNHTPSKMSLDTFEKLKKHIEYMIDVEGISGLHIDWFGGEPLMYFNEIVYPLSEFAKRKCDEAGIPFGNGATTNAYYINKDMISKFESINFRRFQITIDGLKELHDRVKFIDGCPSAFDHSLAAINGIINEVDSVKMILRINYTHSNLNENIVDQINSIIEPKNRRFVQILPRKVWQENVDKRFDIQPILMRFVKSGYTVEKWSLPIDYLPCYTSKKYYNAINYNGQVVKCTANDDIHKSEFSAWLNDDGTISYDENYIHRYKIKAFENERCLGCKLLPVCMGVCARNYDPDNDVCVLDSMDGNIERDIINMIEREYAIL